MRKLFKNKKFLLLVGVIVVLIVLAAITAGSRSLNVFESITGTVIQPVQTFAIKASDSIINFFQRIFKTTDTDKENEQLQMKLAQLEQIEAQLEIQQEENDRLKALLNYAEENASYQYVTARVIGMSQGVWFDVFTINAGRNQGVKKNMPVVNASGLIGRVTEVGATWSKVTTIIDSTSDVSIMVERTRDNGMVRGLLSSDNSEELELYFLPAESDIVPGDIVVTNGIGGIFPKGIVVGTVIEVARETEGSDTRNALVSPAVDFLHIEEVMVMVESSGD